MDGRSSRPSPPLRSKTLIRGLRSPRKDRGGRSPERAWSGAEGDCAAGTRSCGGRPLAGCRSHGVRQTMPPRICGRFGRALRRRGLANGVRNATACRRVELKRRPWAARRTSDLGREEPAYAARISRNTDAFACNSGDSSHTTGLLRACICTCGESGIGANAIGRNSGSLGRARNLSGD